MPRTLTDAEDQYYQRQDQIAQFAASIFDDPTLSEEAKSLVKKKYPKLDIPDYDLRNEINDRLDKEKAERDEERKKAKEAEDEAHYKKTRKDTQEKYGFTDEAMKDLEAFMVERNIGDYDVAASYKASKEPRVS